MHNNYDMKAVMGKMSSELHKNKNKTDITFHQYIFTKSICKYLDVPQIEFIQRNHHCLQPWLRV